ncbi:MAG: DUF898 domain-containing protein [Burkholderiales bacterium]|nr:DUF898 domain-containing protein [Burkholderiales bacterium]
MQQQVESGAVVGAPVRAQAQRRYPVVFTASAPEYFRIWIVNLALTVITLGIYSAWAKVRRKRYFYGHTLIDGDGFEYRGNPVAILKGRVVALALLAIYSLAGRLPDLLHWALLATAALALPWLALRSFAFNARNSAWRNVAFRFDGSYRDALIAIVGYGVLVPLSAFLLYPLWKAKTLRFAWRHHGLGTTRFAMPEITGALFWIYIKAAGLVLPLLIVALVVSVSLGWLSVQRPSAASGVAMSVIVGLAMLLAVYLPLFAYVRARTANLVMNGLALGPLRFESRQGAREVAWLYLSNAGAIALTLGLAVPWAVVRAMRYRASRLAVVASGSPAEFAAAESEKVGATGGEVMDLLDFDIGV